MYAYLHLCIQLVCCVLHPSKQNVTRTIHIYIQTLTSIHTQRHTLVHTCMHYPCMHSQAKANRVISGSKPASQDAGNEGRGGRVSTWSVFSDLSVLDPNSHPRGWSPWGRLDVGRWRISYTAAELGARVVSLMDFNIIS